VIVTIGDVDGPTIELEEGIEHTLDFQFSWRGLLALILHRRQIPIVLSVLVPAPLSEPPRRVFTDIEVR
jgi:hypothetical protein